MKSFSHFLSQRQLVIFGLSVPVLLMFLIGWLQWQSARDFRASREGVTRTRTVLLNLQSFLSCLEGAETGQRGYLLTHNDRYLQSYREALANSPRLIATLRVITSPNPEQQQNFNRLELLAKAKLGELAQTVSLEQSGDHAGAMQIVTTDYGETTMDQIRTTLRTMQDIENDLLLQREAIYKSNSTVNLWLSGLLIALGFAFIAAVFLLLRQLERLQSIVTLCAWTKMIEYEGEWLSIEEYLKRRHGTRVTHGMSKTEADSILKLLEKSSKAA